MRHGYLRGVLSPRATQRQMDVLAAYAGRLRSRRNYATTTTTFPNFWPVSAYL
jgi:hypothetical protein